MIQKSKDTKGYTMKNFPRTLLRSHQVPLPGGSPVIQSLSLPKICGTHFYIYTCIYTHTRNICVYKYICYITDTLQMDYTYTFIYIYTLYVYILFIHTVATIYAVTSFFTHLRLYVHLSTQGTLLPIFLGLQ